MTELPPLPEPDDSYFDTYDGATVRELYEAMRSYASAAVAADRERRAKIVDSCISDGSPMLHNLAAAIRSA